jgi:hypothetical protein
VTTPPGACPTPFAVKDDSAVHQNVDAAVLLPSPFDSVSHARFVGDIALNADSLTTSLDDGFGTVHGIVRVHIYADDLGPFIRQTFGDATADIRAGSRDEGYFTGEFH